LRFWTIVILERMASFYVENFGCRAARADGEAVSARLRAEGLAERAASEADVVVVNTCSVTAEADRDARAFVRKTRRINPMAKVVVTGCYAQRAPQELAGLEGVAAVVGNSHKGLVPEIVQEIARGLRNKDASQTSPPLISPASLFADSSSTQIWADDRFAHSYIEDAQVMPGLQTRPNLKIQEGCGNRCTFCVIPTTRGASRSLAAAKVLAQVRGFVATGGKELVLSGINLGRWGRDLPENRSLAGLLREILSETELPRLRLSSIEPMDWTLELIGLMREFGGNNLARHVHLPLQSGSDGVLRRMHRRYRPWHYQQKAAALLEAAGPELALGADVMVGFPGESDAEFRETHDLIASLPFAYLHLFPFSPRPGTRGWELHRQTPVAAGAVSERMAALRSLAAEKSRRFREGFVGRSLPAITLHTPPALAAQGRTSALSDNYLPLELTETLPANQLVEVRIAGIHADGSLLAALDVESALPPAQIELRATVFVTTK
jgi:threonylcarbamoyladenosine tRNA methylthiotransferase MtaB